MNDLVKPTPQPTPPAQSQDLTLPELASLLNKTLDDLSEAYRTSVTRALNVGRILNQAKAMVGHGNWKQWLDEHCPRLPERTATRYMKVADNRKMIEEEAKIKSAKMADITLRQAERLITKQSNGGGSNRTGANSSRATEELAKPLVLGGNDPTNEDVVIELEEKLVTALKNLKRNDLAKAKARVTAIINQFKAAELLPA